jgi:hypothetical protein
VDQDIADINEKLMIQKAMYHSVSLPFFPAKDFPHEITDCAKKLNIYYFIRPGATSGSVISTDVRALAVQGCRVMDRTEPVRKVFVTDCPQPV